MLLYRVFCRASSNLLRSTSFLAHKAKLLPSKFPLQHHAAVSYSVLQQFRFCSSTSPSPGNNKEYQSSAENTNGSGNAESETRNGDAKIPAEGDDTGTTAEQTKEPDLEDEVELIVDDLKKLLVEKEELLITKQKEIQAIQDKFLRAYAEMENVKDRTKRDAENSKKFAIQNFAQSLLDVADNLGRASSVVKESFSKIDTSKDSGGAVPLLKTLLDGVEMTEKQLAEVFKKFGVEKFDPTNEPFDPNKHNAVFQVPDGTKPPGTVAHVLKVGYMLYDRVIRPAEVGVTQELEKDATENNTSDKEGAKDGAADKDTKA